MWHNPCSKRLLHFPQWITRMKMTIRSNLSFAPAFSKMSVEMFELCKLIRFDNRHALHTHVCYENHMYKDDN